MESPYHSPHYHAPAPKPSIWVEVGRFMGLFAFFFILLSLVVMAPTIYTQVGYYFTRNTDDFSEKFDLPTTVSSSTSDIADLVAFVDQKQVGSKDTIIIPRINVEAPIVYTKTDTNTGILEAIQSGVGHYPGTALPGRVGNVFLTGHSSYYWWSGGEYNQVFALLDRLEAGDLIYIYYQGDKFIYRVRDEIVVQPTDTYVLEQGTDPILSLMTCTPIGTNLRRLVVRADLIGRPPVSGTDFQPVNNLPSFPSVLPLY